MRIIGGTAGGFLLRAPKGLAVRPTPDLVRQAIFNSLASRIPEATVLDLFSGTGAIGLECLSRGARRVVSVERSGRHAAIIRANLENSRLPADAYEIRVQEVFAALEQLTAAGEHFDLILADPPFGEKNVGRKSQSDAQKLLDDVRVPRLLAPGGIFILGHARRDQLTPSLAWRERKTLKHGDSIICLLEANPG